MTYTRAKKNTNSLIDLYLANVNRENIQHLFTSEFQQYVLFEYLFRHHGQIVGYNNIASFTSE